MRPISLNELAPKTLEKWCEFFHAHIGRPVLNRMVWSDDEAEIKISIRDFRNRLGETYLRVKDIPDISEVEHEIDRVLNWENTLDKF